MSSSEWRLSLSLPAQTTLYYLTIPAEGYLIWWTPFATRETPTPALHNILDLLQIRGGVNVHGPVSPCVALCVTLSDSCGSFPVFLPKTISSPLHFIASCIPTAAEQYNAFC